ncbi:transporter substrate-binding domain-containing protein [Pseudomonas sp. SK3(2021)]|uniref:transporter substrate-binding domain-containing protein n=1 Tax=Pseudomonas sp. SK3(2021) TaxID=2841064 RepID=UPI00192C1D99|nr:transporter substrate-binding domain-containing protein [Pseudomonas sp. SK3(2021)]QQZ39515.1 transporter substrate-binding domain-containing protein [Pseudomonas sp. SK3(2021)]
MNRLFRGLALLLMLSPFAAAHDMTFDIEPLTLFGRSHGTSLALKLDEADWRWLRDKRVLRLGTAATDSAPLDLTANPQDYEGLTADYAELLADMLRIEIQVLRFPDRAQAIAALKHGELDLLGSASGFEAADPELAISRAYTDDQPVLVTRSDRTTALPKDLEGQRLSMSEYYLSSGEVRAFYPKADLQVYPTDLDAISAVVFGQADVHVGGALTSRYLINRNFLSEVQLTEFAGLEVTNIGFALRAGDESLLRIINHALAVVPTSESTAIMRRWGGNAITVHDHGRLDISPNERRWLTAHPRLRVAVIEDSPPVSFFDQQSQLRGISSDVLNKISSRTGLKFEVVRGRTFSELGELIRTGKADLIASINHNFETEGELRFTRPYLTSPYVLVSRNAAGQPDRLDQMAGKRLVLSRRSTLRSYIQQNFPDIILLESQGTADSMAMIAEGRADASISTLVVARYLISNQYQDRLRISGAAGLRPALVGLATSRGSLELYSILDKVLMSISPEEMNELTGRWNSEVMVDTSQTRASRMASLRGFALTAVLLSLALGWILYLRGLIRKREAAERALSEQMSFMRVLIDGLPHPIYVRDRETRMLLCNSRYLEISGRRHEEIIGTRPSEGLGIEEQYSLAFEQQYQEVMAAGKELLRDCQLMLPDGRTITAYHWILPFRDNAGEVKGIIAGWIDISEREQLLGELKEAKREAENANRAKTTFLATMSHEIRTPMNAVVGMLELAMKRADHGILDRFAIEVASGAARGMLDLIGDILDVVRIESGRLTLNPQRTAFKDLVESVVRVFDGLARQKQLALVLEFDEQADREVLIDPLRLKQVLSNLLSNAIKFTSVGQVLVSVEARLDEAGESLGIRLLVRDTGIGISAEDQLKLFAPFSQAGADSQSTSGGSGLGLMISRTLCSMMQGQLNLTSVPGLGTQTEVLLDLPILPALPTDKPAPAEVQPGKVLSVLVVDDYPANRMLLSQQLNYLGHNVQDEQDGAHGLRSWRNHHFDVVITDCNMPVMNGYDLAKAIRAEEELSNATPCLILGFTANAQPEEIDRCLAAGMDDCLFKPIGMKDLMARLSKVESAFEQAPEADDLTPSDDDIDLGSLEQLTCGDRASINSLLQDLASSNEEDLLRLLKLFSQNDLVGLGDLAHRVKGGARIIKAKRLIQCCEQLQNDCNGLDGVRLTQSVDALHEAMEALARVLEKYIGLPVD